MIIIRTLRKDIAKYNMADEDAEDSIEETGWKLVHGDVFRPPFHNKLFAAVIGSGIQIFAMLAITIFFAMLGMLSPASRGALLTAAIFLYDDDDDDDDNDDGDNDDDNDHDHDHDHYHDIDDNDDDID